MLKTLSSISYGSLHGTRWFWSIEIESGKYSFLPDTVIQPIIEDTPDEEPAEQHSSNLAKLLDRKVVTKGLPDVRANEGLSAIVFQHNALHDLESIWWMVLFGICMPPTTSSGWSAAEQFAQLDNIFSSVPDAIRRYMFFKDITSVRQLLGTLDNRLSGVKDHVLFMYLALIKGYKKAENLLPTVKRIDRTAWARDLETGGYSELQDAFHVALKKLANYKKWPQYGPFLKRTSTEDQGVNPKALLIDFKRRRTESTKSGTEDRV